MGLLGSISNTMGSLFGSDAIKDASAAGREELYGYSREARADLEPFKKFGQGQIAGLESLMADPSSVANLPGYQFKLSEGLGAIERSKLAKGKFFSGETPRDILDYAEGLASSSYQDEFMRRFNLINLGQSSAAGQANVSTQTGTEMLGSWTQQGQDVASLNAYGTKQLLEGGKTWASGGFGGGTLFK